MKRIAKISIGIIIVVVLVIIINAIINKKNVIYTGTNIEYNYYKYYSNEKFGVIDNKGNILIEAKYSNVIIPNPIYPIFFLLENNEIKEMRNDKNEEIFKEFQKVMPISVTGMIGDIPYEKNLMIYKENEKLGLINFEGRKLTNAIYTAIESVPYKEGELLCKTEDEEVILNSLGKEKVKLDNGIEILSDGYYDENYSFEKAGYIVSKESDNGIMQGYISYNGKKVLNYEFDEIKRINNDKEEYLITKKNGKYGLYKNKENIINCIYQDIRYVENIKMLLAKKGNKYGILNLEGNIIIPIEYNSIEDKGIFIEAQLLNNEIKKFDLNGKELSEVAEYNAIHSSQYDNTYIAIKNDYSYEILDNNYISVTKEKYEYIENILPETYIIKSMDGKYGILNIQNKEIVEPKYDVIQLINSTEIFQAMNISNNTIFLYDKNGKKFFEEQDSLVVLLNNYIKVFCNEGVKYFDKKGKEIKSTEIYQKNNIIGFYENGKFGFKDKNNKIIIEAKYDRISEINENGYGGIKINELWGIIDSNGNIIVEPKFYIDDNISEPEFLNKFYKSYYASSGAFYIE